MLVQQFSDMECVALGAYRWTSPLTCTYPGILWWCQCQLSWWPFHFRNIPCAVSRRPKVSRFHWALDTNLNINHLAQFWHMLLHSSTYSRKRATQKPESWGQVVSCLPVSPGRFLWLWRALARSSSGVCRSGLHYGGGCRVGRMTLKWAWGGQRTRRKQVLVKDQISI